MPVTQKDIAERVGLSVSLVSRVLSGHARKIGIAAAAERSVLLAAKELGYIPSAAARALKGKSPQTIAVVVYDFSDPYFAAAIAVLQDLAHEHGYSLMLLGFRNRHPDEADLLPLQRHVVDGLIAVGSDASFDWLERFQELPVARLGQGAKKERTTRVFVDEASAAADLVGHLAERGHQKLAFISQGIAAHPPRATANAAAARARGLSLRICRRSEESPYRAGFEAATDLLHKGSPPDVLVCATDRVALGALAACSQAGRVVPEQVAVTGFDDIPDAEQAPVPLTTVRQPLRAMAERAFKVVLEGEAPGMVSIPGTLMIRQSA